MSQNKSPDGSYPDFPFVLAVDGEGVTEDKLCVSATTGLGWIGKLIDAVGYLRARSPQLFTVSTAAGVLTTNRRTPLEDGTTPMFSSIVLGTTSITFTFTTAFASDRDYAVFISNAYSVPGDRYPYVVQTTTTTFVVRVWDISAAADVDVSTFDCQFNLAVYPNLAGMT